MKRSRGRMKYLIFFFIFFSFYSHANINNCMRDAGDFGHSLPMLPDLNCRSKIEANLDTIKIKSDSGRYQVSALGNIIYLDTFDLNKSKLTKREMLAGDQTGLTNVIKIWLHEKKKRLLVLQSGSPYGLLTFSLGNFSNTAPLRHFNSPLMNNFSEVKLLDDRDEIALMSRSAQTIIFINSDADNVRYKGGDFTPKILREIKGHDSMINNPLDVVINSSKNAIYVLDTARVLVFDLNISEESRPKSVLALPANLKNATGIELNSEGNSLVIILPKGKKGQLPLR